MRETKRKQKDILKDMLSGDMQKIWSASCEIVSLSQNHEKIMELVPYTDEMYRAVKKLEPGGFIIPHQRVLEKVFQILHLHKEGKECPCRLLGGESNPKDLIEDGYFEFVNMVYCDNKDYIDSYTVLCKHCHKIYQVEEREYHFTWWEWTEIGENSF